MKDIYSLEADIFKKNWGKVTLEYAPAWLVENLSFQQGMVLSKWILEYIVVGFDYQTFAVDLINTIKDRYPKEWKQDWRHEAYLGYAYGIQGWHYEEKFDAYKAALEQSKIRDPELLICMAIDWECPGVEDERIDKQTAVAWLEEALQHHLYPEAVSALLSIYTIDKDAQKQAYWKTMWEKCDQKELSKPYRFLDFFKEYEISWSHLRDMRLR